MNPLVTKLEPARFARIKPHEYLESQTLLGKDGEGRKYVSHDMGVTWEDEARDIVSLPDERQWFHWRHPQNQNAILAWTHGFVDDDDDDSCCGADTRVIWYYTKDGGATWEKLKDQPYCEVYLLPTYDFVVGTGDVSDLIYLTEFADNYTEYALDIFSESPLKFNSLPFKVRKTPEIFFGFKRQDLYVSKDGVNFEHVEFPHSTPFEEYSHCSVHGAKLYDTELCLSNERSEGSLFFYKHYPRKRFNTLSLLFRYDVKSNKIKFMIDYCYDIQVISAKEGILIANIITNFQEVLDNNDQYKIKSLITFNDGADWQPMKDTSGAELSVFNQQNNTIPGNPGLVIAHGQEGTLKRYMINSAPYMSNFPAYLNHPSLSTYITRDLGRSWQKVDDAAMKWVIGGDGQIIILYPYFEKSTRIKYSLDGGWTWNELHLDIPEENWSKVLAQHKCSSRRFLLVTSEHYYLISFDPADQKSDSDTQLSNECAHKL